MSAIWIAVLVLSALSLVLGGLLGYASRRFEVEEDPIVEQIDAILPQSQCGQCGHPGCRPYADAVGNNGELINKCVPGGEQTMLKLAALLNIDPQPLAEEASLKLERKSAWIDEAKCIGCTKCIQACPVDAIVGATRAMHTVLSDVCTGCELCVAPCPTDCIEMRPVATTTANWKWDLQTIPVRMITVESHV
ncbi:electron transport complex subunit RsxB [Candidatus Erwinia dacicola]|uniref:Ion-translocating oxidoreductase complex subunit B n=1 Tax=Candidatus Erwinia dacicola TaxID=252393 RepID=A0A1E7YUE5_9GAMM|nr:electron transport complex subunit RsxB [Candidatus Erwinia dacicola]NJD00957.1 electron transport complex subunit RsxB [Candidatus Erwinia dacicola]NJD86064.1 electron transport complex subunit RsxB [Candidatus Erwinia dacicola]OFC58133.1 electron transport complex subunit RsxB [Candidatus Erwinia dacicola]RAP71126.1 electron transport complex, RnfABCDGE type, B subunit [Candidatus Erwinia dacicola]